MEETYNSEAIILDRRPFREVDSRLVVLTKDRGKLELIARGARKISSKTSGHIEPIMISKLMIVGGRQYRYIGSSIGKEFFPGIKSDLDKLELACRAVKLVDTLSREGEVGDFQSLFLLLKGFLNDLNARSGSFDDLDYYLFVYEFLRISGFAPDIDNMSFSQEAKQVLRSAKTERVKKDQRTAKEIKSKISRFLAYNFNIE